MTNIGSKISTAASAINPFRGTVNTEKTGTEDLSFHGTEITLNLGSTGNFALRKIYNSIVNAPGHAFNAVGLKSFTNYLYPETRNQNNSTESRSSSVANNEEAATHGDAAENYTGSLLKATSKNQVVIHPNEKNEVRDLLKEQREGLKKLLRDDQLESRIAKVLESRIAKVDPLESRIANYALKTKFSNPDDVNFREIDLTEENLKLHNQNNSTNSLSSSAADDDSSDDGSVFKSISSVAAESTVDSQAKTIDLSR